MRHGKNLSEIVKQLRKLYPVLSEKNRVTSIGIFGSYIHHEHSESSDLDLLVTFDEPPSLFKYIELEDYLSDTLGVKVDLVMQDSLKPAIRDRILRDVQMI
jgi:predicted nucleotidyltransferase